MPYIDREGTPEHTTHFESCGCSEAREAALRAENKRLKADNLDLINGLEAEGFHNEAAAIRIAQLEAPLADTLGLLEALAKRYGFVLLRRSKAPEDDNAEVRVSWHWRTGFIYDNVVRQVSREEAAALLAEKGE